MRAPFVITIIFALLCLPTLVLAGPFDHTDVEQAMRAVQRRRQAVGLPLMVWPDNAPTFPPDGFYSGKYSDRDLMEPIIEQLRQGFWGVSGSVDPVYAEFFVDNEVLAPGGFADPALLNEFADTDFTPGEPPAVGAGTSLALMDGIVDDLLNTHLDRLKFERRDFGQYIEVQHRLRRRVAGGCCVEPCIPNGAGDWTDPQDPGRQAGINYAVQEMLTEYAGASFNPWGQWGITTLNSLPLAVSQVNVQATETPFSAYTCDDCPPGSNLSIRWATASVQEQQYQYRVLSYPLSGTMCAFGKVTDPGGTGSGPLGIPSDGNYYLVPGFEIDANGGFIEFTSDDPIDNYLGSGPNNDYSDIDNTIDTRFYFIVCGDYGDDDGALTLSIAGLSDAKLDSLGFLASGNLGASQDLISCDPVSYPTGVKSEAAVDLIVEVPGPDFVLKREYSSDPTLVDAPGADGSLIGRGWSADQFRFIVDDTANGAIRLGGPPMHSYLTFTDVDTDGVWDAGGASTQVMTESTVEIDGEIWPVWTLTEPGKWTMHFVREKDGGDVGAVSPHTSLYGLLLQETGPYSDNRRTYLYHTNDSGGARLYRVYLNGTTGDGKSHGIVQFNWMLDDTVYPTSLIGMLESVQALRPLYGNSLLVSDPEIPVGWRETQRVEYFYADLPPTLPGEMSPVTIHADVGQGDDLIQVVHTEYMDRAPDGVDPIWKGITQYRYHTSMATGAYGTQGADHQLKMVILPEQLEYHAQKWNEDFAESPDLGEVWERAAGDLLEQADESTLDWASDPAALADLAAKVVGYYTSGAYEDRVSVQFIQTGCGCSSSSSQGLRQSYNYDTFVFTSDSSGDGGLSLAITEEMDDGAAGWDLHRTLYYDMREIGGGSTPYLVYEAIVEPAGAGGREWATERVYDSTGRLIEVYTPSANNGYTENTGQAEPDIDRATGDVGLVYKYTYNSKNRREETMIGDSGGNFITVSKTTYMGIFQGANGDLDYTYLPETIERYKIASPMGDDDIERTRFEYGFRSNEFVSPPGEYQPTGYDIGWMLTVKEAELQSTENGPNDMTEYARVTLFDSRGRVVFEPNEWGRGTRYEYADDMTDPSTSNTWTGNPNIVSYGDGWFGSFNDFGRDTSGSRVDTDYISFGGTELATLTIYYDEWGRVQTRVPTFLSGTDPIVGEGSLPHAFVSHEIREDETRPGVLYRADVMFSNIDLFFTLKTPDTEQPVAVNWMNAAGMNSRNSEYVHDPANSFVTGPPPFAGRTYEQPVFVGLGEELSRETTLYTIGGNIDEKSQWTDLDAGAGGTKLTTRYEYDVLGRLVRTISPTDSVVEMGNYDVLGRYRSRSAGVDGSAATLIETFVYDDLDGDQTLDEGVGNGVISWVETLTGEMPGGAAEKRVERRLYDHRDRLILHALSDSPTRLFEYDNQDRVAREALFSSTVGEPDAIDDSDPGKRAGRGRLIERSFGQRGLVHETRRSIDPTASSSGWLTDEFWYDRVGRLVVSEPHTGPSTVNRFDTLNRRWLMHTTDGGLGSSYASDTEWQLNGVKVLTQLRSLYQYEFDPWGSPTTSATAGTTYRRFHSYANMTGSPSPEEGDLDGQVSIGGGANFQKSIGMSTTTNLDLSYRSMGTTNWGSERADSSLVVDPLGPDLLGLAGVADVGTAPPQTSDSTTYKEHHTSTTYNRRGLIAERRVFSDDSATGDDRYVSTLYLYDDLGRVIATIQNYVPDNVSSGIDVDGEAEWTSGDPDVDYPRLDLILSTTVPGENIAKSFGYDSSGRLRYVVAHNPGSVDQITQYQYGVTKGSDTVVTDSLIDSNDLLREINYPGESNGLPVTGASFTVAFSYNALGEIRSMTDQNGTVHEYKRDGAGRITSDTIVSYGGGNHLDETIDRISTEYDGFGRVAKQSSERNESGYVVDSEVEILYTELWEPRLVFQDSDGPVTRTGDTPTGSTKVVSYRYNTDASSNNRRRPVGITYPDGSTEWNLQYDDGATPGLNDDIDRIEQLVLNDGQTVDTEVIYSYLGLDNFATVEYPMANVMLDRTYNDDGARFSFGQASSWDGTYPGWDEYFRPRRQSWIRTDSAPGEPGFPTLPPIFDEAYEHDLRSNRTHREDVRPGACHKYIKSDFVYDGSDRLESESRKGCYEGIEYDSPDGSRLWQLDTLGNWDLFATDTNADGQLDLIEPTSDSLDPRLHNAANEIYYEEWTDPGGGIPPFLTGATVEYDNNGNMVRFGSLPDQDTSLTFHYDAWNRLVYVEREIDRNANATVDLEIWIRYNARNWRVSEHVQTNQNPPFGGGGNIYKNWLERHYYSLDWQVLRTDLDTWDGTGLPNGTNKSVQYFWGIRALDDLVMRRLDSDADGDCDDDTVYFLTDALFSPRVAVGVADDVTGNVNVREHYYFNPYGGPELRFVKDVNWDGLINSSDKTIVDDLADALNNTGGTAGTPIDHVDYNVDADLNNDGIIDTSDKSMMTGLLVTPLLAPGEYSKLDGLPLRIGLAGYQWAPRLEMYLARNRYMDPRLGRWITRDPKGYIDGPNTYQYVGGQPIQARDPMGLEKWGFWDDIGGIWHYSLGLGGAEAAGTIWSEAGKGAIKNPVSTAKGVAAAGKEVGVVTGYAVGLVSDETLAAHSGIYDLAVAAELRGTGTVAGEIASGAKENLGDWWEAVKDGDWGAVGDGFYIFGETIAPGGALLKCTKAGKLSKGAGAVDSGAARTNADLIQEIALRAERWGERSDLGTGGVSGTLKHGYADRLLTRHQQMFGDRGLSTEVRYRNGAEWQIGDPVKGSVRLDVVEGPRNAPTAVYDYKFGNARLTESRIDAIRNGAGLGSQVGIFEVKP